MNKISIKDIPEDFMNNGYLCHLSGEILHNIGDIISLQHLEIMQKCGITSLLQFELDENPSKFQEENNYKSVSLDELFNCGTAPVDLLNSDKEVKVKEGEQITESTIVNLQENGISSLIYKKDETELGSFQIRKYKALLDSEMFNTISEVELLEHPLEKSKRLEKEKEEALLKENEDKIKNIEDLSFNDTRFFLEPSKDISQNIIKEGMQDSANLEFRTQKSNEILPVNFIIQNRDQNVIREYCYNYKCWIEKTESLFNKIKQGQQIEFDEILLIIKPIFKSFIEDAYFCLNLPNLRQPGNSPGYVYSHAVNVCIYSIAMANYLNFDIELIIEIAVNALLHDIGHMLTFKPLFIKTEMDNEEQQKYDQHAIVGVSMLKNFDKIPVSVPYTILQHHENLNGTGRILHCKSEMIHKIAQLIMVVDRFERIATIKTPFEAISKLLESTKSGELNSKIFKAFIDINGFYPLGCYVLLKGNIVCKVIGINKESIKEPIVKALFRAESDQIFELDLSEQKVIDLHKIKNLSIEKGFSHNFIKSKIALGF